MAKLSNATTAAEKPVEPSSASTGTSTPTAQELANLEALLTALVKRRKNLGEYNADSADILAIADALLVLIRQLK